MKILLTILLFCNITGLMAAETKSESFKREAGFKIFKYGLVLLLEGDYKRALEYFKEARKLDPGEKIYQDSIEETKRLLLEKLKKIPGKKKEKSNES